MKTFSRSAVGFATCCALLLAVGCKKKDPEISEKDAAYLQEEGIVFREGFMEQTIPGMTSGVTDASTVDEDCAGYLPEEPTAEITFVEDVPMRIHVTADDDLVLAVQREDRVYCNDDFDGHQPSIARTWEEGKYKVYVGTQSTDDGALAYELNFDHYDPSSPLKPTPLEDPDAIEDPLDAHFELPLLEDPSSLLRLSRGTLAVDVKGDAKFGGTPYVPTGIARHRFELDRNDLKSRTYLISKDNCEVLIDEETPDYIINLAVDGDMNLAIQSPTPMGLVITDTSDRVYCDVANGDEPAALRFENLKEGKYAVYMGLIPEAEAPAKSDASASEKDTQNADSAEDSARKDGASVADDVAAKAARDAARRMTLVRGILHIY